MRSIGVVGVLVGVIVAAGVSAGAAVPRSASRCGPASKLVPPLNTVPLWRKKGETKVEVSGFSAGKRAKAVRRPEGLVILFVHVAARYRGTLAVRGLSCRTGRAISFGSRAIPGGGKPSRTVRFAGGRAPYQTDLLPLTPKPGKFKLVASRKGRKVGSLIFVAPG